MKLKYSNQYLSFVHTFAAGANIAAVDAFPALSGTDAFILRQIRICLDASSASPTVTGAGLSILAFGLSGKLQVAPVNILAADKLITLFSFNAGASGAAALYLPYTLPEVLTVVPVRNIYSLGHTVNITNAATTILRVGCLYDVYTLTNTEYIQYLG